MTGPLPRIWVLLGRRRGDNNQVLALAEALGLPFETRSLDYNLFNILAGNVAYAGLFSLKLRCRRWIRPPWPDLIIAIGRRSVPIARWIQRANGGRTKVVRTGHPRLDPALFDLVITTRQYPVPPGDNVILLPLAMSRYRTAPEPSEEEQARLAALSRPHLLMAIGGPTKYWTLSPDSMADAARRLAARAAERGGSLIAIGSQRTEQEAIEAIQSVLDAEPHCRVLTSNSIRFPVLLQDADEIFVTGDSVSMVSEAVLTGKPVGLIPIELSARGEMVLGPGDPDTPKRDLRRFWKYLRSQGLIGSIEQPAGGVVQNPADTGAAAVRRLLGDCVE